MRIHALAGPVVVGALLVATPQLALGQTDEKSAAGGGLTMPADIADTRIEAGQLGEFLANNLSFRFGTDMRPLSVTLRVVLISQEDGVIGTWESAAVEVETGKTYDGSTLGLSGAFGTLTSDLGDRRRITMGRFVVINHEEQYVPRECEGATHALGMALASTVLTRPFVRP